MSVLGLLHTYLFYPLLLQWLARDKPGNGDVFSREDADLPLVSVICSLYNEEKVIPQKLESLFASNYPADRLFFYFGSDHSTDQTDSLLARAAQEKATFYFFPFSQRRGKPGVVNDLVNQARKEHGTGPIHVLLLTDANVLHHPDAIYELAKHFKNPRIALVDARMIHTGMEQQGISRIEDRYIGGEVMLKHREGKLWGAMMGPFGGCYALRSDYYTPVPPRFLVDDFFIALSALARGGMAISELHAICYEGVSHNWREEYRRKRRIGTGNFQNLQHFMHLWWPPLGPLGFAFFSHKILRWAGPFLLVFFSVGALLIGTLGNLIVLVVLAILLGIGLLCIVFDPLLSRLGINFFLIRGIRYFLLMNLALLHGFFNYLKGVKSNVWKPTKRN